MGLTCLITFLLSLLAACGADKSHPYRAFRRTHPAVLLPQLLLFCSYLQQMVLFVAMAQTAHCHVPDLREASPSTTGHVSHLVQL